MLKRNLFALLLILSLLFPTSSFAQEGITIPSVLDDPSLVFSEIPLESLFNQMGGSALIPPNIDPCPPPLGCTGQGALGTGGLGPSYQLGNPNPYQQQLTTPQQFNQFGQNQFGQSSQQQTSSGYQQQIQSWLSQANNWVTQANQWYQQVVQMLQQTGQNPAALGIVGPPSMQNQLVTNNCLPSGMSGNSGLSNAQAGGNDQQAYQQALSWYQQAQSWYNQMNQARQRIMGGSSLPAVMGGNLTSQMLQNNPLLYSGSNGVNPLSSLGGAGAQIAQGFSNCGPVGSLAGSTSTANGYQPTTTQTPLTGSGSQLAQQIKQNYGVNVGPYSDAQMQAIASSLAQLAKAPGFVPLMQKIGPTLAPTQGQLSADFDANLNCFVSTKTTPFTPQIIDSGMQTGFLTYTIAHELGHIIYYCGGPQSFKNEHRNAYSQEGGVSAYGEPFSGGQLQTAIDPGDSQFGASCTGSPAIAEDYAEMVAYYLVPNFPENGSSCKGRTKFGDWPYANGKNPLHLNVAKQIFGEIR